MIHILNSIKMSDKLLLLLSFLTLLCCPNISFGQAPDLRSTRNFALFTAAGQFENVGAGSTVTGDAGTNVGAFLAYPPGTLIGVKYGPGTTEAAQAATDVALVYGDLAALTCDGTIGATLGSGQILTAGIYCTVGAGTLDGDLLLDAEGDPSAIFVIRINGAFSTSTFANVLLVNGANLCNVYWQIGGQFTLGGGATFLGTVVADGAIILNIGSTLNGRALSTAGAISTFDNTVTMSLCLAPTLSCSVAATASCENLVPAPDIASVTVTATCPGVYTVIHVGDVITNQTCPNRYTITRTYKVTDACGETATCAQLITVNDQIPPLFTACPVSPFALGCNPPPITAAQAITAAGAATDNCGTPTLSASGGVITGDCLKSQTWTVTATDACNNMATCQVTFTWNSDTQNPSFTNCPTGPISLGCNPPPVTAAQAIAAAGSATDNCGTPTVTATGGVITGTCLKSQTWTVTATDGCNNAGDCLVTFTWTSDTQNPTFTNCPTGPVNLGCTATPPTAAGAIAAAGSATDNCGNPIVSAIGGVITGDCLKSQTWTVTATDGCNNSVNCLVTFNWSNSDAAPPTFTNCPTGPIILGCNPVLPTAASAIAAAGTATDDCGNPIVTATGGVTTGTCLKSQTWTVTATDVCNNAVNCLVTFTWTSDTQNPSFSNCPTGPVILGCTATPPTAAGAIAAAGPATDNCGVPTVSATGGVITGDCLKSQTWTVTATDGCNNSVNCLVTFNWSNSDAAPPMFSNCPTGPINLGCNPPPVTPAQAIAAAGPATDDCGNPIVTATGGVITGTCLKSQTWTVTATDVCNNAVNCLVTFNWNSDTQNPSFTNCPAGPVNLGCNPPPVTPAQAIVAAGPATDNCGNPTVTAIGGVITGVCLKSQTWTVTATDFCNNAVNCLVTFTWTSDTQNPTFSNCPTGPVNLGCTPTPPTAAGAIAAAGPATDNCGVPTVSATGGVITGDCLKSQTWTVTATDGCNNSVNCLVTFNWSNSDAAPPTFTNCPTGPINLGCNPVLPTAASAIAAAGPATDDCGNPIVTATSGVITGTCLKSQTWTVTATDVCNNAVNCLVTFTWTSDTQNPSFTNCPAGPINLGCNPPPVTPAQAIAAAGPATDNCGNPTVTAIGGVITGVCLKSQTWTVTATDFCNNAVNCLVTFNWNSDTQNPSFTNCPAGPINLGCNPPPVTPAQAIAAAGPATDNCGNPTVTAIGGVITGVCLKSQTWTVTATDFCNNAVNCLVIFNWNSDTQKPQILDIPNYTIPGCNAPWPILTTPWTDNCSAGGILTATQGVIQTNGCAQSRVYTFSVVDACNNTDMETTTVTRIYDITKPVFSSGSIPPNVTVQCNTVPPPPPTNVTPPMATDNCDPSVTVTMTEIRTNGACFDTYILTRKWTAMDDCGNTRTATQRITVRDTQKPVFTFIPPNQTLECADFCVPVIPVETPVAIDNCAANVTILYLGEMCTYFNCPGNRQLMRTWKATDNCGNWTTAVQLITIQDTQKPNFTFVPPPITIECSDLFPVTPGTPTATDDCDPQVQITFNGQTSVAGDCPQEYVVTRKWTATDDCGNTRTATQTITVWDTQAPVFNNPPPNMTAMCGMAPSAPIVTATDNCDTYVPVTYLGETNTGPNCPYTITRTWTVMDDCGNPRTHTQIINVGAAPINGPTGPESNTDEISESRQTGDPAHALNVLLAPNPAFAEVWISFETETEGDATLRLFDVSGRLALQQSFVATAGPNRYRLDLAGLSGGGMYTLQLLVGERHAIERLIILSN